MATFDSFVKGELETAASAAETEYQKNLDELPAVPSEEDWEDRFSGLDIPANLLEEARQTFENRRTIAPNLKKQDQIAEVSIPEVAKAIDNRISALSVEIETLEKAAEDDKTPILETELSELKAREWLSAQEAEVIAEIERLEKVRRIDEAIKKVDTSSLTKLKNRLATTDLIGAFQTRFGSELGVLGGGSIKVLPAGSGVGKGKVIFDIQLQSTSKKSKAAEVLSEGERRVVGLATFLADVSQQGKNTPFIFDDPITSLDQDYEENVVKRLVELAKQRQVIVFTHRLSLKALISDAVKKQKQITSQTGEEPSPNMEVAIVRSVGGKVGVVTDSLISEKNVVPALNTVLQRANGLQKVDPADDYESFVNDMTSVCSDFRTLIERTVEEELLNNIVGRFRRSIITQGKLPKLSMITVQDAELLDDLMTRYSVFEHSQSMEFPTDPPGANEVAKDIEVLRDWIKEFRASGKGP
jgi:energy-coupling factor transporter ATP-binding protein EcfA2